MMPSRTDGLGFKPLMVAEGVDALGPIRGVLLETVLLFLPYVPLGPQVLR